MKAEAKAGLPKLEGGTCHPTMLRCYDHPDDADVVAVTSEPRKRREIVGA